MAYVYRGEIRDVEPLPVRDPSTPGPKPTTPVFDPSRCGSLAGYKQHEKTDVPKCQPCKTANADYSRDYEARVKIGQVRRGFRPDKCGTKAGHSRHIRHNVPVCDPCAAANTEYMAGYRATAKAAA